MAGDPWWSEDYEKNFYEAILVMILVILALLFEFIFHSATHWTEHSYSYGISKDHHIAEEHLHCQHKKLYRELAQRVGGEFMTLGFLAACIFVCNFSGLFDTLAARFTVNMSEGEATGAHSSGGSAGSAAANSSRLLAAMAGSHGSSAVALGPAGMRMPITGADWLHLAEEVHIRMFCGMLIYFCVMGAVVRSTVNQLIEYEELANRKLLREAQAAPENMMFDSALKKYLELHEYLIVHILGWHKSQPDRWEVVVDTLWEDSQGRRPSEDDLYQQTKEMLEKRLSVAHYLSFALEEGIASLVEVHETTWVTLIVIFGLFMLFHWLKLTLVYIGGGILLIGVICLACTVWHQKRQALRTEANVHRNHTQNIRNMTQVALENSLMTVVQQDRGYMMDINEFAFMRSLETILFIWCYSFASILINPQAWEGGELPFTLLEALLYAICTGVCITFLPSVVTHVFKQISLPPKLDDAHFEMLVRAIHEEDPACFDLMRAGLIEPEMRVSDVTSPARRLRIRSGRFKTEDSTCLDRQSRPQASVNVFGMPEPSDLQTSALQYESSSSLAAALADALRTPSGALLVTTFVREVARHTAQFQTPPEVTAAPAVSGVSRAGTSRACATEIGLGTETDSQHSGFKTI
eukprot:TRINITY_DN63740_c0_g1_i1.p1 TRINITY_DN63740_c0_g1~~TRINITY_DN63740_c0_g1_i1.p1  ORF type:complete len:646 (-),score=86.77 TRINITY_DN63740_c0_g1_i1:64-1974(-)